MSGLHPGSIFSDLKEVFSSDNTETEVVEAPPRVALSAFEENKEIKKPVAFKPVSAEEKRKGAQMYVQRLAGERDFKQECKKQNEENIRLIIRFQEQRPTNPCTKQVAFDYWARRILLDRVR